MLQYVFLQYSIPTPSLSFPYVHLFRAPSILVHHTNNPQINHNANTVPIIIPANLKIATLFPDAAILPNLLADPFNDVLIEENVSEVLSITSCARALSYISTVTPRKAVTFAESSDKRLLFWRSRSYASDIVVDGFGFARVGDVCTARAKKERG